MVTAASAGIPASITPARCQMLAPPRNNIIPVIPTSRRADPISGWITTRRNSAAGTSSGGRPGGRGRSNPPQPLVVDGQRHGHDPQAQHAPEQLSLEEEGAVAKPVQRDDGAGAVDHHNPDADQSHGGGEEGDVWGAARCGVHGGRRYSFASYLASAAANSSASARKRSPRWR